MSDSARCLARSTLPVLLLNLAALPLTPTAHANQPFDWYGRSYTPTTLPPVGEGSFGVSGDFLPDGRILAATGNTIFLQHRPGGRRFAPVASIDPDLIGGPFDPSFLAVSPSGTAIALGAGFGKPIITFSAADLGTPDRPRELAGDVTLYNLNHFDAAWLDDTRLAITSADFGSPAVVSLLDARSDPDQPDLRVIIDNIGGASAGIAFDRQGRLYTGNGFALAGPSETGFVKAFDAALWQNTPADFENQGVHIADVLSAASLRFDAAGNLIIGGGDFGEGDTGYLAVAHADAVDHALDGLGPVDRNDPRQLLRLDPLGNGSGYFGSALDPASGALFVTDGSTWFRTVPTPAAAPLLALLTLATRRRR